MARHVVKVFDLERKKFYVLGGDTPPTTAPTNLCVSADGYKFVVESMPALIQVFDPEDNYVTHLQGEGWPARRRCRGRRRSCS